MRRRGRGRHGQTAQAAIWHATIAKRRAWPAVRKPVWFTQAVPFPIRKASHGTSGRSARTAFSRSGRGTEPSCAKAAQHRGRSNAEQRCRRRAAPSFPTQARISPSASAQQQHEEHADRVSANETCGPISGHTSRSRETR
jgi:hypothetical protein